MDNSYMRITEEHQKPEVENKGIPTSPRAVYIYIVLNKVKLKKYISLPCIHI